MTAECSLSGTQRRVYEDTTKTSITNVTGDDLDKVQEQHGAERPPVTNLLRFPERIIERMSGIDHTEDMEGSIQRDGA